MTEQELIELIRVAFPDAQVFYGASDQAEIKSFNIKDGLGIKLLQKSGIEVAIITGRTSAAVERRAAELNIATLLQGREDKGVALQALLDERALPAFRVAYMGDDLPDLSALKLAGLATCPNDAAAPVAPHPYLRGPVPQWQC